MRLAAANRRTVETRRLLPPAADDRRGARRTMLCAALQLFADRGYGGTSVRDIATAAGVQPAALYAHFPSKQHVLAELITRGYEEHQRRMRAALIESSADPVEQIAALVRAHVGMNGSYAMLAVVANAELHSLEPEFAAPVLALRKQSEQMLVDVVRRGVAMRVFDVPHEWLAIAWIGAAGLRVANWYSEAFELTLEQVIENYVEYAWRVLGVKRAAP